MLSVDWMDQQLVYEALMLLISCGCKKNCATKSCSCMSQGFIIWLQMLWSLPKHESKRVSIRKRYIKTRKMITIHAKTIFFVNSKKGGVILLYYFKMCICWNNLVSTSYVLYFLLLDSSYCSNYCSSNLSKINFMGVILYIWQKRGIFCINLVVKNLESNNQYLFPQTMISRFNLLPHRHFYISLSDRDSLNEESSNKKKST
jgi:hypothetical protein